MRRGRDPAPSADALLGAPAPPRHGRATSLHDHVPGSEWRSRGYLPHRDTPFLIQMITFRLADSLPAEMLEELRQTPFRGGDAERREAAEAYLDAGHGACHLRDPAIADLVQTALLRLDGERYHLLAWSIMLNHVHVLVEMLPGHPLAKVLHAWKSYTAHAANRVLRREGSFWQREYWDRYIRDEEHLANAIRYIQDNRSPFSSACAPSATPGCATSGRATPGSAGVSPASAGEGTKAAGTAALPGRGNVRQHEAAREAQASRQSG